MSEILRKLSITYKPKAKGPPKFIAPAIIGTLGVVLCIGCGAKPPAPQEKGSGNQGSQPNVTVSPAAPATQSDTADSATASMSVRQLADHINEKLMPTQKDERVRALWQDIYRDIRLERMRDAWAVLKSVNPDAFKGECKSAVALLLKKMTGE